VDLLELPKSLLSFFSPPILKPIKKTIPYYYRFNFIPYKVIRYF